MNALSFLNVKLILTCIYFVLKQPSVQPSNAGSWAALLEQLFGDEMFGMQKV